MYYNKVTNELSSLPPWGNSYVSDTMKKLRYKDWQEVPNNFTPPERYTVETQTEVPQPDIELAEALIEVYTELEEIKAKLSEVV